MIRSEDFPLPTLAPGRGRSRQTWIAILRKTLANAARATVCTTSVTPHRLRHTFATTMLRLGVSLPALMQLLGHKDIHMTLRYLDVTQQDVQREFHRARQKAASLHPIPKLLLRKPPHRPFATIATRAANYVDSPNASSRSVMFLIASSENECTLAGQLMEGVDREY